MADVDKLRADFAAAVQRRNAGRAEAAAADEEIGKMFAKTILLGQRGLVTELAEKADVSRTTAYAMAARSERAAAARRRLDELAEEHKRNQEDPAHQIWIDTPTGRKFLHECTDADLQWWHENRGEI